MSGLITTDLVRLDAQLGQSKDAVIDALAAVVAEAGRATDAAGLAADVHAREAKSATGMPGGLAIPHCRSEHVTTPSLAFARLKPAIDFGAKDGAADLVFMIAAPASGDQLHMKLLTQLARALVRKDFTEGLRQATTADEVVALVDDAVALPSDSGSTAAPKTAAPKTAAEIAAEDEAGGDSEDASDDMTILAITSCPTGIAHTFMAAEALEEAGKKAGVRLIVEPQGSVGAKRFSSSDINAGRAIIFATDVGVRDRDRFAGMPVVKSSVKDGIHHADELVAKAVAAAKDPDAERVAGERGAESASSDAAEQSIWVQGRTALLTGVSYMIPFVAAGGLLIALAFLLGGYLVDPSIATKYSLGNLPPQSLVTENGHVLFGSPLMLYIGAVLILIGKAAFGLFVPALAGYIAYAIADRPGIAPGFVVGLLCAGEGGVGGLDGIGAGFIGAIVGGFLAGVVAKWLAGLAVPAFIRGLMPVVIIPLVATFLTSGLMLVVLGRPLAWVTTSLQDGLTSMSGSYAVLLGVVLGLMMCFDLGGPVNKAAYAFATTGLASLTTPNKEIMAAVMLSGMVPPLALALASTVRPHLFTLPERENGRAAWLLGASFISEGAIPFAAADPLRVIPSMMLGGALTGGLSMAGHVQLSAPHGGIFVIFAVDGVLWFILALVLGVLVSAAAVTALKTLKAKRTPSAESSSAPA